MDAPAKPRWTERLAIVESLRGYRPADFLSDATAGLIVGCVAIPLAIAFAIGSHANPTNGLVTVVIAGSLAALFGGSRFLVTGPTGAFVVVLAGVVDKFELLHPGQGLSYLLLATLVAGILLVLAGVFKLGTVIKFIPYPVTVGFTAGIAVVIFANQTPDLFGVGLGAHPPAEPLVKAWEVLKGIVAHEGNRYAIGMALGTIAVIQLIKKFIPRVPGPIVAVGLFTIAAAIAGPHLPDGAIITVESKYNALPQGLPAPAIPSPLTAGFGAGWTAVREVFPSAITIAMLGAIESLLAAVVADGMVAGSTKGKTIRHDSNQELIGQGIANIGSPLFGGIAATGAIARTATNIQNGGRTPVSALVHVAMVAAVLYFFAPYAGLIPMACLAGILAVVAWNMSERHHFAKILRMPRSDAAVMIATFGVTVLVDLTWGVMVGLIAAFALFLHRMSGMTRVGAVDPLADTAASEHRFTADEVPHGVLVYSIDGPFFFGAADQFSEAMARVSEAPKVVVLRMRDVPYLDATGLNALERAIQGLQRRGTIVMISAIQSQPLDMLERSGAVKLVGDAGLFRDTSSALAAARMRLAGPAPS
ncbi:MAG: SulP family inorganic anion transporter [bacterium]